MNAVASTRTVETRRAASGAQTLRRSFVLNLEHGLHARPCAVLVKTLQPYHLEVEVEVNGEIASGKSILGLMALGAGYGSNVTFAMTGEKAFEAMAKVERIFATNFEAAYLG
jgi:phosphotransferase system HPr (HPr) family protein